MLKKLQCPSCGAPLELSHPNTQTVVCPKCKAYITVGADQAQVLSKGKSFKPSTPIRIGTTAKLDGTNFLVMGHVQYEGWDANDHSDRWKWDEYLLGGDDGRMLWLSYDEKGYSLYTKYRLTGEFDIKRSHSIPLRGGGYSPISERYPAQIVGAQGELTWKAKPGDRLYMAEGTTKGKRYSVQQSTEELEIYEGIALNELTVAQAFGDKEWIKSIEERKTKSEIFKWIGILALIFSVISVLMAVYSENQGEYTTDEVIQVVDTQPSLLDMNFDQVNRPAVIAITVDHLPENTYADFEVSVKSPNEVTTFLFEDTLWHETGVDSDGFWRESSYRVSNMFVPTIAGLHTLEIAFDEESTAPTPLQMRVSVRRNHITPMWLVMYAVVTVLFGGAMLYSSAIRH